MSFKVTHVDHLRRRRQVVLRCNGSRAAQTIALAMYGDAFYLAVIRITVRAEAPA